MPGTQKTHNTQLLLLLQLLFCQGPNIKIINAYKGSSPGCAAAMLFQTIPSSPPTAAAAAAAITAPALKGPDSTWRLLAGCKTSCSGRCSLLLLLLLLLLLVLEPLAANLKFLKVALLLLGLGLSGNVRGLLHELRTQTPV
jgi:hypothetical protein